MTDEGRDTSIVQVPVALITPEEGLSRQRSRDGHEELRRSIAKFGVLTPVTVRVDPARTGSYLLVKGQGRTLACRQLGLDTIPAVVLDHAFSETEKVQQFLVENVTRLRMQASDRALLIARARRDGEEASSVARRFGVSATTVRKLEAQIQAATDAEIHAIAAGDLSLGMHALVARRFVDSDRDAALALITDSGVRTSDLEEILNAIDWSLLSALGPTAAPQRFSLLNRLVTAFMALPRSHSRKYRIMKAASTALTSESQS